MRASGDEGLRRIHELRICAREIDGALGARAGKQDVVGAAAALALVEAGVVDASRYARWARTPPDAGPDESAWRPLGARSLVGGGNDGARRRRLIVDPDEEVRRNALHAALEARDAEDLELVLEAARVDPYPAARAQAIRAAGALGGDRAVMALKDLWARADAPAREAIVDAWATRGSLESGGRRELGWVVDTQRGIPAILAAAALVRAGGAGSVEATGALERALKNGPTADRLRAIELAPFDALRDALARTETDPDEEVAVAAMARRLQAPAKEGGAAQRSPARDAVVAKLLPIASGNGLGMALARTALAHARVQQIVPTLERDGISPDAKTRSAAGTNLAVLGDFGRAAVVAADLDPEVRSAVSCAILDAWAAR